MTREQARDLIPIIQAFADGKDIQWRRIKRAAGCDEWHDFTGNPVFDDSNEYRIKPPGPPAVVYIHQYPSGILSMPSLVPTPNGVKYTLSTQTPDAQQNDALQRLIKQFNLPPLPPVPDGKTRWEWRGREWRSNKTVTYAYCLLSGCYENFWNVATRPTTFARGFYLEAV